MTSWGTMRASRIHNYDTARRAAARALPRVLFDFIDGGADDEVTLAENHAAFGRLTLLPRQAAGVSEPKLATRVLGTELSMPVALAPCGGSRLVWPDGERALVAAAGSSGTVAIVSTASSTPLEAEAAAATGPVWFQLYYPGTRQAAAELVGRADEAGFRALVVTVDMPLRGNQERVRSAERLVPPRPTVANAVRFAPQLLARPRWTLRYVLDGMPNGVAPRDKGARRGPGRDRAAVPRRAPSVASTVPPPMAVYRPATTWADVEWLRSLWAPPLVVKGVLTAEDARRAVDAGADGLVVSNHGGRQLDGAPSTIAVLPEVREAVGQGVTVLLDGGVRRGTDVAKALALGADAVLLGRYYLYGLATAGQAGVRRVLELVRKELATTLVLLGRASVGELDPTCVGWRAWPNL